MTTSAGAVRPAVIMMLEGRVSLGGQHALEAFHGDADDYIQAHVARSCHLQWDDADPLRFRATFEYDSEGAFEALDVRSRVDPQFSVLRSRFLAHLERTPVVSIWRETAQQYCGDLVRAYWGLLDAKEWIGLREILADDVVMEWPAFNERVVGADAVVEAGKHAPKDWVVRVECVLACGEKVATEVIIALEDGEEIALATFWDVCRERIQHATEYWSVVGRDPRPGWRRAWSTPIEPTP